MFARCDQGRTAGELWEGLRGCCRTPVAESWTTVGSAGPVPGDRAPAGQHGPCSLRRTGAVVRVSPTSAARALPALVRRPTAAVQPGGRCPPALDARRTAAGHDAAPAAGSAAAVYRRRRMVGLVLAALAAVLVGLAVRAALAGPVVDPSPPPGPPAWILQPAACARPRRPAGRHAVVDRASPAACAEIRGPRSTGSKPSWAAGRCRSASASCCPDRSSPRLT